jgi:hypothetical protein
MTTPWSRRLSVSSWPYGWAGRSSSTTIVAGTPCEPTASRPESARRGARDLGSSIAAGAVTRARRRSGAADCPAQVVNSAVHRMRCRDRTGRHPQQGHGWKGHPRRGPAGRDCARRALPRRTGGRAPHDEDEDARRISSMTRAQRGFFRRPALHSGVRVRVGQPCDTRDAWRFGRALKALFGGD